MRATAQDPSAARLMGINVDRVIGATFVIGGALAGAASVIYGLYIHTISYQMGFQNGLYAFTAAVLGGIGNIPGAVLGGLVIGLVAVTGQRLCRRALDQRAGLRHLDRDSGVSAGRAAGRAARGRKYEPPSGCRTSTACGHLPGAAASSIRCWLPWKTCCFA